jgi:hypothetical protein
MRKLFLIVFISASFNVNSQNLEIDKIGLRVDGAFNMVNNKNDEIPNLRASVTYNIKKFQIYGGIVFTDILEKYNISRLGLAGGSFGSRYFINFSKKACSFFFLENMILSYHTYKNIMKDSFTGYYVHTSGAGNRTKVFQPIIGSGVELKFLKYMTFSIDFGFGPTYRNIVYDFDSSNPEKLNSTTGQFKISLGFTLDQGTPEKQGIKYLIF